MKYQLSLVAALGVATTLAAFATTKPVRTLAEARDCLAKVSAGAADQESLALAQEVIGQQPDLEQAGRQLLVSDHRAGTVLTLDFKRQSALITVVADRQVVNRPSSAGAARVICTCFTGVRAPR